MDIIITNALYKRLHNKICRPKCEWGLGIKRIEYVNATFLGEQDLKVATQPQHLGPVDKS